MFWNLFERIINAVKPSKEPQVPDTSQPWEENNPEQPTEPADSCSSPEEVVSTTPQNNWQE